MSRILWVISRQRDNAARLHERINGHSQSPLTWSNTSSNTLCVLLPCDSDVSRTSGFQSSSLTANPGSSS